MTPGLSTEEKILGTRGYDYPPEVLGHHPGEPGDWGLAPDDEDDE